MKISKCKSGGAAILLSICMFCLCDVAYAAEDYTTITVEATDDESGVYMYAIDSTEDSAWQTSNTFYVEPNTRHTVYVKDAAGNITSSEVYAEEAEVMNYEDTYSTTEGTDDIEPVSDDPYEAGVGTGMGTGTVTDYVNDDSKEYYTITTKNGNNFYMIIDHRNSDSNVYFTKPVSELDLLTLAAEAGEVEEADLEQEKMEELPVLENVEEEEEIDRNEKSSVGEYLPMIVLLVIICAGYYYFMIYKKKKAIAAEYDEDAADMEQFIPVDDDEATLFNYKGNKESSDEEQEDMDAVLDEFYDNNPEINDFEENQEEEYDTGIPDDDFNVDEPIIETAEDQYDIYEDHDPDEFEDEDKEEDDM